MVCDAMRWYVMVCDGMRWYAMVCDGRVCDGVCDAKEEGVAVLSGGCAVAAAELRCSLRLSLSVPPLLSHPSLALFFHLFVQTVIYTFVPFPPPISLLRVNMSFYTPKSMFQNQNLRVSCAPVL